MVVQPHFSSQGTYHIRVMGQLDVTWQSHFEGLTLSHETYADTPTTLIAGVVSDQAALYGILDRIRDLGLTLINVERLEL